MNAMPRDSTETDGIIKCTRCIFVMIGVFDITGFHSHFCPIGSSNRMMQNSLTDYLGCKAFILKAGLCVWKHFSDMSTNGIVGVLNCSL